MLLAAAAVIVVTASLSPEGTGLRFVQVPEGILIVGLPQPPAELALPANELAPIPTPAKRVGWDRWGPADENSTAAFCADLGDAAACTSWVEASWRRRRDLAQVLSPRYVLTPGETAYREVRAAEAIKHLTKEDRVLLTAASPRVEEGRGVVIPWEAMPARSGARMDRLSVEIRERTGGRWQPYLVRLREPRNFTYGRCHAPFEAGDTMFGPKPGFYFPQTARQLDSIFAWMDPSQWNWEIVLRPIRHDATAIPVEGPDEEAWVCGPTLSFARRRSDGELATVQIPWFWMTDSGAGFRVARSGPDALLVLAPPRLRSHKPDAIGGSCAGALAVAWETGLIDTRAPSIRLVRSVHQRMRCDPLDTQDYAVEVSEDLRTFVEYLQEADGHWRSRRLTWNGRTYHESPWRPSGPAPATALPQGRDVR